MVKRILMCLGLVALILQLGTVAMADTLFDNGGPATLASDQGGSSMSDFKQADNFSLSTLSSLTGIRFWDQETRDGSSYLGSISWEILGDNAGAPGTTSYASGSATPTRTTAGVVLGFQQYQNDFSINVPNLAAGTYWLVLHDGPLSSTNFLDFYWSWNDQGGQGPGGDAMEYDLTAGGSGLWNSNSADKAFAVYGSQVPEPGSMLLLGTGLVGLVRRFKK